MDRQTFEYLRDLPEKAIVGDISLKPKKAGSPVLISGPVPIKNSAGVSANLYLEFNEATNSKTINVMVVGVRSICRLEVDAREHQPFGRSHKHALLTEECPEENLKRDISERSELSGLSVHEVFTHFCQTAHIQHQGELRV